MEKIPTPNVGPPPNLIFSKYVNKFICKLLVAVLPFHLHDWTQRREHLALMKNTSEREKINEKKANLKSLYKYKIKNK